MQSEILDQTAQNEVVATKASEPLVWDALWAAMRASHDVWIETTEGMFWDMLEVLPPRAQSHDRFLVGEAARHDENGKPVYSCFKQVGTRFYAKDMTVEQFKAGVL
jgi:hypothetical protein